MPPRSKKSGDGALGRAIVKRAAQDKRQKRSAGTGFHVADLETSKNPLQSITEVTSLEEFMSNAVLAERGFQAERNNLTFVSDAAGATAAVAAAGGAGSGRPAPAGGSLGLADTDSGALRTLRIPRRPAWDEDTTREELHRAEKDSFLEWRRAIAKQEAAFGVGSIVNTGAGAAPGAVTPFEKNIEVWRQLWRVVERSDVLVQIVDARNPLLFRCPDLDGYVKEVHPAKRTLLLINKADYLTPAQRLAWARFLGEHGIRFVFFSARREQKRLEEQDRARAATLAALAKAGAGLEGAGSYGDGGGDRPDLSAGLLGGGGAGSDDEDGSDGRAAAAAASVGGGGSASVRTGASAGFLGRSAANKKLGGGAPSAKLQKALAKALLWEDDDESSSSEGEAAGSKPAPADDEEEDEEEEEEEETDSDGVGPLPGGGAGEAGAAPTTAAAAGLDGMGGLYAGEGDVGEDEAALAALVPRASPLFEACRILTRDELAAFFETAYADMPRGVLGGPAEAAAQRKRAELRERRKAEAAAARAEELARRAAMAERLIEVGLGAQVRFGDAGDLRGEKGDDDSASVIDLDALEEEEAAEDEEFGDEEEAPRLVIGMVGYPNVGKSSTINALLGATAGNHAAKRVAVAATPGKTKHFQTLILNDGILLCDCPGLVFPSFVSSKEEMVVNGVLPIDQLRDYAAPVRLVCQRIPRGVLETHYGLALPAPGPGQHRARQPTVWELLETFCRARGYAASTHGGWDMPRAARVILKDYCFGGLLYCHPPPGGWLAWAADVVAEAEEDDAATAVTGATSGSSGSGGARARRGGGGGGGVSFADNVLLPSKKAGSSSSSGGAAAAGGAATAAPAAAAAASVGAAAASAASAPAAASAAASAAAVASDDDEDEEADADDLEGLDEETLAAFARVIPVGPKKGSAAAAAYAYEDDEEEDEEEEEEEEDSDAGGEGRRRGAAAASVAASTAAASEAGAGALRKKDRGLLKPRRLRKGEKRPEDPYGTRAAADAANRRFELSEIAAVAAGPAAAAAGAVAIAAAGLADVVASGVATLKVPGTGEAGGRRGATAAAAGGVVGSALSVGGAGGAAPGVSFNGAGPVSARAPAQAGGVRVSKAVSMAAGGAAFRDAVPAHLRGQVGGGAKKL